MCKQDFIRKIKIRGGNRMNVEEMKDRIKELEKDIVRLDDEMEIMKRLKFHCKKAIRHIEKLIKEREGQE